MAKRKPAKTQTTAESYRHADATVSLRPEVGTQTQFKKQKPPATYSYDSSLSPQLVWTGKAERLSFDVPTLPLFVHEWLSTQAILQTLKGHKRDKFEQLSLFADPQHSITDQVLRAYEHRDRWTNRLVLGDSLVVMNSQIELSGVSC